VLYVQRFYYGIMKPIFVMGKGNSVETMACLVSGGAGFLNATIYGLFAIGWISCDVIILLFGLGKK